MTMKTTVERARAKAAAAFGSDPVSRTAPLRSPPVLASGRAVGAHCVTGVARFVSSTLDLAAFRPGEILMADYTLPEWQSVMNTAAAIITNQGGRACHAATTARKLGVPAVVGTVDGASRLWTGATLTVSCAQGVGRVYEGVFPAKPAQTPAH
jgi:pyruvate,water dikinase